MREAAMRKAMTNSSGVFFLSSEHELSKGSDQKSAINNVKNIPNSNIKQDVKHISEFYLDHQENKGNSSEFENWLLNRENLPETKQYLCNLAKLIANITESYTAVIFLACPIKRVLKVAGVHTLSRDFNFDTEIAFGQGLVGWTAENAVRILVCPFEHDATSLHYYRRNQDLKSFIAVPIFGQQKQLLGVISCDSKKSYAYAKLTEKLLLDCAEQASVIVSLSRKAGDGTSEVSHNIDTISEFKESLRNFRDERSLLNAVANLPEEIIERDAIVVMTTTESGIGAGKFYSSSTEAQVGHRLLETVCKHNKVLCAERTVRVLPSDDNKYRSFVSVPFHVMDKEAGSINLLSKPRKAFRAEEIFLVEEIANILSHELELIRLRDQLFNSEETSGLLSFKHFSIYAREYLANGGAHTLIRLSVECLEELEDIAGAEVATLVFRRLLRLTSQVIRSPSIVGHLYGTQILVLSETKEAHRILPRLQHLIDRLNLSDLLEYGNKKVSSKKFNDVLANGLFIATAQYGKHGKTLQDLMSFTRKTLEENIDKLQAEKSFTKKIAVNSGSW